MVDGEVAGGVGEGEVERGVGRRRRVQGQEVEDEEVLLTMLCLGKKDNRKRVPNVNVYHPDGLACSVTGNLLLAAWCIMPRKW